MSSRRLRTFKKWMLSHSIIYSDALEFVDSPNDGISVRALCNLKEGDLVATIPKISCLTIRTSGISSLIETAGIDGCLALALAVMYERSLGAASPWEGYLQLLLDRECIPLTWSLEQVDELLVGTELHKTVKEEKRLLYWDWEEHIEPLIQSGSLAVNQDCFGFEQYLSARSLISSRSFEIDEYHGSGMVPLADLFNHKTGAENVHFTLTSSSSSDDESIGEIFDASHDDKSSVNNLINTSVSDPSATLEIIVVKEVAAGDQVFNTYGYVGNAALLHRYGFTEPDNPFDIVNIDLDQVLQWCSSSFSSRYVRARLTLWRKLNYSGCSSPEDSEYFEIASNGEPQIELMILLYIIFLSEGMYQKLNCGIDYLAEVNEAHRLFKLLEMTKTEYCEKKSKGLKELLLNNNVCRALVCLADVRERPYGTNTLKEDIIRFQNICRVREKKLHYSLILRLGERQVLGRLRSYARRYLKLPRRKAARRW